MHTEEPKNLGETEDLDSSTDWPDRTYVGHDELGRLRRSVGSGRPLDRNGPMKEERIECVTMITLIWLSFPFDITPASETLGPGIWAGDTTSSPSLFLHFNGFICRPAVN